jgi:hypothetical protein
MKTWDCQFCLDHYREILLGALGDDVNFIRLRDTRSALPDGRVILMRHDIDFSVLNALEMARLEHSLGVAATYCVLLHSPLYNIGDVETCKMLREILALGHEIALHYDLEFVDGCGADPWQCLQGERGYLKSVLGTEIVSVAQHKPASSGLVVDFSDKYVDAYIHPAKQGLHYISDSGRLWRGRCVHDWLGGDVRLQVLIHPEWWCAGESELREDILKRLTDARQEAISSAMLGYGQSLKRYLVERPRLDSARELRMQAELNHRARAAAMVTRD